MVRLPAPVRPLYPYLKPAYSYSTGLIAPFARQLSRLRGGFLPSGVVQTVEQAAASTGGRCLVARSAETLSREVPQGVPAALLSFAQNRIEVVPRVAVAELPNARVLGPHSAVITGAGDLVHELSYYFGTSRPRQHPLFLHPFPGPPQRVEGRLGVLATRGDVNYYHFLMDVLPRLGVLEQCPAVAVPERWYVPAQSRFQRELLDLFEITTDRRIDSTQVPHIQADCLVLPGPPSMTVINPPWVVGFLRERLLPQAIARVPGRFIYVTRGDSTRSANNRHITNAEALRSVLTARGFQMVDPAELTVSEQIRTFAEASVIVAAHGAALANLVFASAGAQVIELFPAGLVLPDYWKLAAGVPGLDYRYLAGSLGSPARSRAQVLVSDITVDLSALCALLDESP